MGAIRALHGSLVPGRWSASPLGSWTCWILQKPWKTSAYHPVIVWKLFPVIAPASTVFA